MLSKAQFCARQQILADSDFNLFPLILKIIIFAKEAPKPKTVKQLWNKGS